MNKTNRIRAFFLLGSGILIGSSALWNYSLEKKAEQEQPRQQTEETEEEKTTEASSEEIPYEYVILNEDGYLTVYEKDLKTVYFKTDISFHELDEELQKKISQGYFIRNAKELYDFLENYSS